VDASPFFYFLLSRPTHKLPLSLPPLPHQQKRLHAKDFKDAKKSAWKQDGGGGGEGDNAHNTGGGRRRVDDRDKNGYRMTTLLENAAFEEYYKAQVRLES
jgi:hypothetical protein